MKQRHRKCRHENHELLAIISVINEESTEPICHDFSPEQSYV